MTVGWGEVLGPLQAGDPQRVGPYALLGRLGSGGMGRVYLARSPGGRMVAVKVIRANLAEDTAFRARFAREVSAARKVGGLFTAQVVDADLDSPVPWLVTAYVPGRSLSDAVEQEGPLPPQSVLALAAGLAEGLAAIHAAGVIHRDLKPSNVLLSQDGPRIIDFGISSAAEATVLTGTGFMIGSPGFMSPEQAEGIVVGASSDIFSLAGLLIYAARGAGPFGTGDTTALLYRVVHGKPNTDGVPDNLRPLIRRSLSRDAKRRPTAAQFLDELSAAYPSAADLSNWLPPDLLEAAVPIRTGAPGSASPPPGPEAPAFRTGSAPGDSEVHAFGAGTPASGAGSVPLGGEPSPFGRGVPAYDGEGEIPAFGPGAARFGGGTPALGEAPASRAEASDFGPGASALGAGAGAAPSTAGQTSGDPVTVTFRAAPASAPSGQGPPGAAGQQGYSVPQAYQGDQVHPGYQGYQGYQGDQQYPMPQGYLTGQVDSVAPAGSQWWAGQRQGGEPGGMPQDAMPTQGPPGPPGSDQWYQPPGPTGSPTSQGKRTGWLLTAGGAAVALAVVIVLVFALEGGHSPKPVAQPTPSASVRATPSTSPTPSATPTVGNLLLTQFQAGDCLTGSDLDLDSTAPWPNYAKAVPCGQAHTAEVFYANAHFWPKNSAFPGASAITNDANAGCDNAFSSYVGIAYSKSIYSWTNIVPDASTWPDGDRALHCVAYYKTSEYPQGVTLKGSIKDDGR